MKAILLLCLVALLGISEARVFTRCELARELVKQRIRRRDLANWVCLIEAESGRDTGALRGPNCVGNYDNGLFQISDQWCRYGIRGNGCRVKCEDLRSDYIKASVKCALLIKRRQGWNAWNGWKEKCKGQKLPDVDDCF